MSTPRDTLHGAPTRRLFGLDVPILPQFRKGESATQYRQHNPEAARQFGDWLDAHRAEMAAGVAGVLMASRKGGAL